MYYLYFGVSILCSLMDFSDNQKIKKISFLLVVFFSVFFIGFRFQNGLDWAFYSDYYNDAYHGSLYVEPMYSYISELFSKIGFNYNIFVFFVTAIYFSLLASLFKSYSVYPACCFTLMSMMMFYFNVEAMRQIIALCFILVAIKYLNKNKHYIYFILCFLAFLCHGSAAVFFIIPFLYKTKLYKCNLYVIVICSFLALFKFEIINFTATVISLVDSGVSEKIIYYVNEAIENKPPFITFNLMYKIVIYVLVSISINKILDGKKDRMLFLTIFSLYICISIIFSGLGTISERINGYFIPFFILSMFFFIETIDNIKKRLVISSLFVLYGTLSLYKSTNNDYYRSQFLPYNNYIESFYKPNNFSEYKRREEVKFYFESKK